MVQFRRLVVDALAYVAESAGSTALCQLSMEFILASFLDLR